MEKNVYACAAIILGEAAEMTLNMWCAQSVFQRQLIYIYIYTQEV